MTEIIVKIIGGFKRIRIITKGTNNVPIKGILFEFLRSLKLLYLIDETINAADTDSVLEINAYPINGSIKLISHCQITTAHSVAEAGDGSPIK